MHIIFFYFLIPTKKKIVRIEDGWMAFDRFYYFAEGRKKHLAGKFQRRPGKGSSIIMHKQGSI